VAERPKTDGSSLRGSSLEDSVRVLEQLAGKKERPSHFLARAILTGLGKELREGRPNGPLLLRIQEAGRRIGPTWGEAAALELSKAIAEFAGSVDPRYLRLPDYDTGYTERARSLLADRLHAAAALGFVPTAREAEMLALADRVWASHSSRQDGPEETAGED